MLRVTLAMIALTVLAGCVTANRTSSLGGVAPPAIRDYDVVGLSVTVPRTLEVSEENAYYPGADIVWRGEPLGDRHAQVEALFETGMSRGATALDGDRPVNVAIEVRRFHSVTEKARYTVGGVHSIRYVITVFDARTGQVIEGPRLIAADLEAFGGEDALAADRRGETQKKRVTDHLNREIQRQLRDPSPTASG